MSNIRLFRGIDDVPFRTDWAMTNGRRTSKVFDLTINKCIKDHVAHRRVAQGTVNKSTALDCLATNVES